MAPRPVKIASLAGIKRDGTQFEGDYYIDGQWCRFQRKLPRKMGGYTQISDAVSGNARGVFSSAISNTLYTHIGTSNLLERITISMTDGVASATADRTPIGFQTSPNNLWQMDSIADPVTSNSALIAHAAPNVDDISSETKRRIYAGPVTATSRLVPLGGTSPEVSGGVFALHPYLVAYGSSGYVAWSSPSDVTDWTQANGGGEAYVTAQKIVYACSARGGATNSPSAIMWSLDSVIRMSYIGTVDVDFSFDTISDESSILSSQSVIEYDGIFFWAGVDRFLMYNGVVREVKNELNLNWFYDNLNFDQRQKVFATKVPRWGEIWWCFPFGDATECTHAVIYNVREDTWYDTILPNGGFSGAQYPRVYQYPLAIGNRTINSILATSFVSGGSNYSDGSYYGLKVIDTTSVAGQGATVNVVVSGGAVTSYTLIAVGRGYQVGDILTVAGTQITSGVATVNVDIPGYYAGIPDGDYPNVPLESYLGEGGSGALGTVTFVSEYVSAVVVTTAGSGYVVGQRLQVSLTISGYTGTPNQLQILTLSVGSGFQFSVESLTGYSMWQLETGTNEIMGQTVNPIYSFFETSDISLIASSDSQNKSLRITMIEPDFVQVGEMTVTVTGRANARSPQIAGTAMMFPAQANSPQEQVVFFKEIRREMRFKFESNAIDGNYQMGQCIAHIEPADGTVLG